MDVATFDPTDPAQLALPAFLTEPSFIVDPYPWFAKFRAQKPVARIGPPYNAHWVFNHGLVKEVAERNDVFLKPSRNFAVDKRPFTVSSQFDDGLFFMNPPRHTEVRHLMDGAFYQTLQGIGARVRDLAHGRVKAAVSRGSMKLVRDLAESLPLQVFMEFMGIPGAEPIERHMVHGWTRAALLGHDNNAPDLVRLAGGTASLALRTYFLGLATETGQVTPWQSPSIVKGMQAFNGCPASASTMNRYEVMNTSVHFALGGYLSTQFLITTGIYHLLSRPSLWKAVHCDRNLLAGTVDEMLRFEAPFQMADRVVNSACELGGVQLDAGDRVTVVYGSANRDEKVFAAPNTFDIARSDASQAFGFGHGIHHCIGRPLALDIAVAAIDAMLTLAPSARLDKGGNWSTDPYFRTLDELELTLA